MPRQGRNPRFSGGRQFGGANFNVGLAEGVEIRSVCQRFYLNDGLSSHVNSIAGLGSLFDALDVLSQPLILIGHSLEREHVLDSFYELNSVDGFGKKIVSPGINRSFDISQFVESGHHQDHDFFELVIRFNPLADLKAAQFGHHHIEED